MLSQCDTGSEPSCTCETAEVLCSISELDSYTASMSTFQHPDDGPSNFCPPTGLFTNNPTWFAFIAWCDDIEMDVTVTNCNSVGGWTGAQLVVYADCDFDEQLACNSDCTNNNTVSVEMNDLTIGEVYYVMLDGCNGSACDFSISVSPTDCDEFIEEWDDPVTDEEVVCIGNSVDYFVDDLIGATNWHWYINGDLEDITDEPNYSIDWSEAGEYELCVDVSNTCVDEDEDPEPNCVTINVADPNAGIIDVEDTPECPNEFMDITVENYNEGSDYSEVLIFTNIDQEVLLVVDYNSSYEFTWPSCEEIKIYSLNYFTADDLDLPDVDDNYDGSDCLSYCCNEVCTTVIFEDYEAPEFDNAPADLSVSCYQLLPTLGLGAVVELDVDDNCAEDEEVLGIETIMADTCNGGTIIREWSYMDACGNLAYHKQTITIGPWAAPQFVNPPKDTILTSTQYLSYPITALNVSNGMTGACMNTGTAEPSIQDNRTGCAGYILVTYTHIDSCGREIKAEQRIDITPDVTERDTMLNICDVDETGMAVIQRSTLDALVSNDLTGYTIVYFSTEIDQTAGTNPLTFPLSTVDLPEPRVYAEVTEPTGCSTKLRIAININALPTLDLQSQDETCRDQNDGVITVITPADPTEYTLTQNNSLVTGNSFADLSVGEYTYILTDTLGCQALDTINIGQGILLSFVTSSIDCNDNDTGTDPSDDFFIVTFEVTGGQGEFTLDVSGTPNFGTYAYDQTHTIELPADGSTLELTAIDNTSGCRVTVPFLSSLTPCSLDCELTQEILTYDCNDNGTPLDASDDFYQFTITISAINGSPSNLYRIYQDGGLVSENLYDEIFALSIPATGETVSLEFEDTSDTDCLLLVVTDPLTPCSNLCQLDINIISAECMDPMTPANNDDDLYDVAFTVSGINASGTFVLESTGETYDYDEIISLNGNLITDGDITINVMDSDDTNCTASVMVTAPAPCSSPCDVVLAELMVLDCDDNGTGINEDDFFFIDHRVSSTIGTGTEYVLSDEAGNEYGPITYGDLSNIGPFPADGNTVTLILSDPTNPSCFLEIPFSQSACSSCIHDLMLDPDSRILDCNNRTIELIPTGDDPIVSYSWEGPNGFTSTMEMIVVSMPGTYTLTVTFDDGCTLEQNITITESSDLPISNAGSDLLLNCDVSEVTLDGSLSQYGTNVIANWTDESGNVISEDIQFNVSQPGTYILQLIDTVTACVSIQDTAVITEALNEPVALIIPDPGDVLNCAVVSIELSHEVEDNTTYTWQVNNQSIESNTVNITEPQTIVLTALDTISECSAEDILEITDVIAYPIINIEELEVLDCTTGEACVTISSPSMNALAYNWYDGSGNLLSNEEGSYCYEETGDFYVEIIDLSNGCENTQDITIEGPTLPTIDLLSSVILLNDEMVELSATPNISENMISEIIWTSESVLSCYDCLNPTIIEAENNSTATIMITTVEGCTAIAIVDISVERIPRIYIPNTFNPETNNFTIYTSSDIETIDYMAIYDRWGNQVFLNKAFEPNEPAVGWDGRRADKKSEQGVYVYYIEYTANGSVEIAAGSITLLYHE